MKILLTGATGYIGKRLLPLLVKEGHHVVCGVRDKNRFSPPSVLQANITVIELDLTQNDSLNNIPKDIDHAFYLVHSMSSGFDYQKLEQQSAINFTNALNKTTAKQVIYLSGIINESVLSKHLNSRATVENELKKGNYHLTTFRAGIIVGSGSASFEIIRDLVEKLPIMITPKWLKTKCQPIGIKDVLEILTRSILNPKTYDQNFDIGSPDILTYKEMLLQFAKIRNLKRTILTIPVMTPKLSSYWLYFVTSTSYILAQSLVDSMKVEVICRDLRINEILGLQTSSYQEALKRAFNKIENREIVSSWKDSYASSNSNININQLLRVPEFGCFKDITRMHLRDKAYAIEKIWAVGGVNGWYYLNWMWQIRGYLDKLAGGVGLRRGRTNENKISVGDALDFWRVLYANKKEGKLLLYAEMKLPGEAWLEFKIEKNELIQTATFRPLGVAGRLYWYSVLPFHTFIFKGLAKRIIGV